jgi:hypothetical protein
MRRPHHSGTRTERSRVAVGAASVVVVDTTSAGGETLTVMEEPAGDEEAPPPPHPARMAATMPMTTFPKRTAPPLRDKTSVCCAPSVGATAVINDLGFRACRPLSPQAEKRLPSSRAQ